MPPLDIYVNNRIRVAPLERILSGLRDLTAQQLSCTDRRLAPKEISLRILVPEASLQIADTELVIFAHHYPERIQRQDTICSSIKAYVQRVCPEAGSVEVWLQLLELGYSG